MLTTTATGKLAKPPVTRRTVLREITRGRLTAVRAGRDWLIEETEAIRWARDYQPYAALRRKATST